ncbi:unnamed protein product [Didymodactylos carnosus]|uniref:Mab-21-like nucleotidyltransferase domain-containing protein n=1 Tax=Didymodactylos carnosus TaxID=1234261 RepID=A0A814QM20_9BILA|nr:unnamed protein product [Didymodactylos carnosus]CAF3885108.1 unnamed protein product [Didymodactylos carnosus]
MDCIFETVQFPKEQEPLEVDFYRKYQKQLQLFISLPTENYSSLISIIFSNDICNDMIMQVHVECEKIKHRLQEEYCKMKYTMSELIISGSGGEQWMPYGDSDIDQMYVEYELVAENDPTSSLYFVYAPYPGYVLLRRGQHTVSHADLLKLRGYSEKLKEHLLYEHGPAYCVRTPIWPNDDQIAAKQMETDVVPCYKLLQWPTVAAEYFHRESRQYQWPPHDFIQRCFNNEISCLLTPVGYKFSHQRDDEWRISFSLVEMELVKTLSKNQRLCYILFKSICKDYVIKETKNELEQTSNASVSGS